MLFQSLRLHNIVPQHTNQWLSLSYYGKLTCTAEVDLEVPESRDSESVIGQILDLGWRSSAFVLLVLETFAPFCCVFLHTPWKDKHETFHFEETFLFHKYALYVKNQQERSDVEHKTKCRTCYCYTREKKIVM